MRKLFALLLILMLAMACACAVAEDSAPLPKVGDVIHGFEAIETRDFPLIGSTLTLFEHQKTGAKFMYIANEDTNRTYTLAFFTRPVDDTGLPHVFEHSTLVGSDKYPYKSLFMNLMNQTYNTYMNAATTDAMTYYPVASLSEEQLLKYADFYTDSCYHPILLHDESIYRQEAWRYRMESMDAPLTLEGTVYSEMLGNYNQDWIATMNNYQLAFPGSVIGFDYGGNPDAIPEMTWENLKAYHSKYYHPSNSVAILYGKFQDYTAFLALLEEVYAPYERQEFTFVDENWTPITEPVEAMFPCPVAEGTDTAHNSVVYYTMVLPGLKADVQTMYQVNELSAVLAADSSPLMQNLHKVLPSGSFSVGLEVAAPEMAMIFSASNVEQTDAPLFKETVDRSLRELAETGFSAEMIDSLVASTSLSTRLIGENANLGVNIISSIAYSYATSGRPFEYLNMIECMDHITEWNENGTFKALIGQWLVDRKETALSTTYPVPGGKEAKEEALAQRLQAVKDAMTQEEKQAIIDATLADKPVEDVTEAIASLQAVTVATLPEEFKHYEITDVTGEDGVRRVDGAADVDGIGRINLYLDTSAFSAEELQWLHLAADLAGRLDTSTHTRDELDVLSVRYLYNKSINLPAMLYQDGSFDIRLHIGFTAMQQDFEAAYALARELVFDTQFTDIAKLADELKSLKATLRAAINTNAHSLSFYYGMSSFSEYHRYQTYLNYLEYYSFLEQVEAALAQSPELVTAALQSVQSAACSRYHAITAFTGDAACMEANAACRDAFLASLSGEAVEPAQRTLPLLPKRLAVIIDNNVQFNAMVADYASLGVSEYHPSLAVTQSLINDMYLLPILRNGYGVYTPMAGAMADDGFYLIAYRDPNIVETFDVYDSLGDRLASAELNQDMLDGYIKSAYAGFAISQGELTSALNATVDTITGMSQERVLDYMRELKAVTPDTVIASAELYRALSANGARVTFGSAGAINAHADLYDLVLNPFGAKDKSQVVFEDLSEDSEYYQAVRYAYESGMMNPLEETRFGTEEPASYGDLVAAIYFFATGTPAEPENAKTFLAGYGLVDPEQELSAPLTEQAMADMFANAFGVPMTTEDPERTMPRGELAQTLYELLQMLQSASEEPAA